MKLHCLPSPKTRNDEISGYSPLATVLLTSYRKPIVYVNCTSEDSCKFAKTTFDNPINTPRPPKNIFSISSNQRRKVLVGVAVPMDQSQSHQNHHSDDEIEALEDCERLDMAEIFDHGQQHDTDLDSFRSNSVMEHVTVEDYVPDKIVCDERQQRPPHIERMKRTSDHLTPNGANPLKLIKIDVNRTKLTNGTDTVQKTLQAKGLSTFCLVAYICRKTPPLNFPDGVKPRPPVTSVIDHPDVSIFNIRGEEFIQMPKSVYLEEKTKLQNSQAEAYVQEIKALREELNQYKGAVQAIKNHLRPLK